MQHNEFRDLLQRARAGCQQAAAEVTQRYHHHILAVVRRHLSKQIRPLFDPMDFTQMTWLEFFSRAVHNHRFANSQHLIAFLGGMARNQILLAQRRQLDTQKNDRSRQRTLAHPEAAALVDLRPSPAECAAQRDEVDRLLQGQSEPLQRGLPMLREGHSLAEVATILCIPERGLRRVLERARSRRA